MAHIPAGVDNLPERRKPEGFEKQRFYRVPDRFLNRMRSEPFTRDFVVSCLGYFPIAPGHWVERPAGLEFNLLILVEKGSGWILLDGNRHRVETGWVVFIPSHTPHSYGASDDDPWSIFWFHFEGAGADALLGWTTLSRDCPIIRCAQWDALRRQFLALFAAVERGYNEHTLLEVSRVLINVITLLHRNPSSEGMGVAQGRIERAMLHIRETLTQPLTLSEYASKAGYSVSRFSYWFQRISGVSPMVYLNELRIQQGCEYLDTSTLSVKEIAYRLGFEDAHYFSRAFSKCTGQSPSDYRARSETRPTGNLL